MEGTQTSPRSCSVLLTSSYLENGSLAQFWHIVGAK